MGSFNIYMLKEAQQEVIPRESPLPDAPAATAGRSASKSCHKDELRKALGECMMKSAQAQPAAPAAPPEPIQEDPNVRHFASTFLPSKSEDISPYIVMGNKTVNVPFKGPVEMPWPDEDASRAAASKAYQGKIRSHIDQLGVVKGYQYTRSLQNFYNEAQKNPELYKKYGIDPNNVIQYSAYQSALPQLKGANDQWKTEAFSRLKGWVGNNWQYIVPAIAGAGLLGWGMAGSGAGARQRYRPAWSDSANWRYR